jgi:hypothetical protein
MYSHVVVLLAGLLGASVSAPPGAAATAATPSAVALATESPGGRSKRLGGYTVRIFKWAYYLVPAGLGREELLAEASTLRRQEPDTQLVLVDDESRVKDYMAHARAVSEGRNDVPMPKAWADAHVVANLQKMMSGKWMLYKGYGYEELGELP